MEITYVPDVVCTMDERLIDSSNFYQEENMPIYFDILSQSFTFRQEIIKSK